jgi:Uma2 family endonuclease
MVATLTDAATPLMTAEEFFALPDNDSVDRMLIQGKLLEKPMTRRNRWHSSTEARIASLLDQWARRQPKPRGRVFSGEGGFVLRDSPSTAVGIDVAYASAEVVQACDDSTRMVNGPPVLAVEILSPNDKQEEIIGKVREYLDVGVALVWIVEPEFQTVTVYRPNDRPQLFTGADVLSGEPHMPDLQFTVNEIFED